MEKLTIKKGGKLVETKWVFDEKADEGSYQDFDKTDSALRYLFDTCELEEDVTLKDIFLLLNTELVLFDAVIGNWCKEIVTEGLTQPGKPYDLSKYDPEQIEYLELGYTPEYSKNKDEGTCLYGFTRPDFGGVGVELKNDGDMEHWEKGQRVSWGISLTPANELINIPVKLSKEFTVYPSILNEDWDSRTRMQNPLAKFENPQYTLGNILHGIIWEMSFHGGPDSRQGFKESLDAQVEEIKNGTAKFTEPDEGE